jgi:hypothetical protein
VDHWADRVFGAVDLKNGNEARLLESPEESG